MIEKLLRWYHGYLIVFVGECSVERFINLCRKKNIFLWKLHKTEKGYEWNITVKEYKQLAPIIRKTKIFPKVKKRIGLPFFLYRYRKRKVFFFSILFCIGLVYYLSLFIWEITVEGQSAHTKEEIVKYLSSIDVYCGSKKNQLSCQDMEEKIRLQYTDIGWVSAEIKGTQLNIRLVETNMPVPKETVEEASHLVASHDGTISSIVTRKGTPFVKKGDTVKKGDILISGVLDIVGDNDVIIEKKSIVAEGDIYLKTRYTYKDALNKVYEKKVYTGQQKKNYGIGIFQKNFFIYNPFNPLKQDTKYDIIFNDVTLRVNESFALPISLYEKVFRAYKEETSTYTKQEAKNILTERFHSYLSKLEGKGVIIKEKKVFLRQDTKQWSVEGYVSVEEPVTEYRKVEESEWRDYNLDELGGENN